MIFPRPILFVLTLTLAMPAFALQPSDSGIFTLLDAQFRPTQLQMRYRLVQQQWHMESRTSADDVWQTMCKHPHTCRLRSARAAEIAQWKRHLPHAWRKQTFSCIRNNVFAFCRTQQPKSPRQRAYWWFALKPSIHALPLKRQ